MSRPRRRTGDVRSGLPPLSSLRRLLPALLLMLLTLAGAKPAGLIGPGARAISPEEAAIAGDGAGAGKPPGVVLREETDRSDASGRASVTAYHFRAKVFDVHDPDLAEMEIPVNRSHGVLRKWWAWTLPPDGGIREAGPADLQEMASFRTGGTKLGLIRMTQPGLVPGSIIDRGYIVEDEGLEEWQRVEVQRPSPVRSFAYRWTPGGGGPAAYHLSGAAGLDVRAAWEGHTLVVTGADLPRTVVEPYGPSEQELGARLHLYYRASGERGEDYWNDQAKRVARWADYFTQPEATRKALAEIGRPEAPLEERLRLALDWMAGRFTDREIAGPESSWREPDASQGDRGSRGRANDLLASGMGSADQIAALYRAVARALGAQAEMVLAADRRDHRFDPGLLSSRQLGGAFVGVRDPAAADARWTLVAPATGLPYGQIPWWFTGGKGLVATSRGAEMIELRPAEPHRNLMETKVRVVLGPGGGPPAARWQRTGSGQQGYRERVEYVRSFESERGRLLEKWCGAGGDFRPKRAEAPALLEPRRPFTLSCEAALPPPGGAKAGTEIRISFRGPWLDPVPEIPPGPREHPVFLPFPSTETTMLDLSAPEGMERGATPPPVHIETSFGSYALFVSPGEQGYHVERLFTLTLPEIPPHETTLKAFREFLDQVRRSDATELGFTRPPPDASGS